MRKTPLLTVAISAYNVADSLNQATQALLNYSPSDLEVIIVNDGSIDSTKAIAIDLANHCPCITLINQKNGGPGAAINTAIKNARGKYFRLLDGDDWFDAAKFEQFFNKLKTETADIIITEHIEIFTKSHQTIISHDYDNIKPNIKLNLSDVNFKKYGPTLPNTTIKTSLLQNSHFTLDKKCFYVDQEYNFICYIISETIIKYNLPVYCYQLEQDDQSMAKASLAKNVYSHEKICLRLISECKSHQISECKKNQLYNNIIIPLCNLQYEIIIKLCHSKTAFLSFDNKLKKHPFFYNHPLVAGHIIKLHRKSNGKTIFLDPILSKFGKIFKHPK